MAKISIERVIQLPQQLAPSTMYVVKGADSDIAELYFTSTNGQEIRHLVNKADINAMIASQISSFNNLLLTPNIASRNALELTKNTLVLVQDATGDPTVNSGAALYFFDAATSTFTKVSEYESLDVTLNWASIADRPESSVEDIDDAVAKAHSHSNSAVLDLLGQDEEGKLTFNGLPVGPTVVVAEW
jgi:hypothetical protein